MSCHSRVFFGFQNVASISDFKRGQRYLLLRLVVKDDHPADLADR